ncbi:MAG: sulfatase-like hydrolase/transferase [Dysgonomonas sp.]|nr:sulfatase-like hydrolase/transferase [Dysgonomonas sp.]
MKAQSQYLPILLTAIPMISCNSTKPQKEYTTTHPNIIVILTDDMGYGDIGTYGGDFIPTPYIDKMASEGIKFTQYYSASPISSPSRAGLLTGMHPGQWHITSYLQTRAGNKSAEMADYLSPEAPTLPHILQSAGYKTGHFGKWHLGGGRDVKNAPSIKEYGYDEYISTYESPDPDPLLTATNWIWSAKDSIKRWDRTAYFVDKTIDFLKRHKGQPCFINLWPDDMHTPWVGNIEELQVFPDGQESEKNFKTVLAEYDKQIGRLLDEIKILGLADNTIVIFTSDNGPAPSFRGSRAGNMRGCKASLYEGGIRMPFIIWGPEHIIPKGLTDETSIVSALDLNRSLCQLANVPIPSGYNDNGIDMSKALKGNPQIRTKPLFWEYRRNNSKSFPQPMDKDKSPAVAVRDGQWKLLIDTDGSNVMLFDLWHDPSEKQNITEKYPDITKDLSLKALNWRKSLPTF